MPRPTRAQGRPGTKVIPDAWEADHATVVRKTCTARIQLFAPASTTGAPAMNDDFSYEPAVDATPLYDGTARIQVANGQEANALTADQKVVTAAYLVVIDRDAADIPIGAIGKVTESTDPTLIGDRRLIVRKVARGSLRWERDLWCVDDLTHTP